MTTMSPIVKLNRTIPQAVQIDIIEDVKKKGLFAAVEGSRVEPFWLAGGFSSAGASLDPRVPEEHIQRYFYLSRWDDSLDWAWGREPLAEKVKGLVDSLGELVQFVTRVAVVIQIPGKNVPAHRDLIVGDSYSNMVSENETFFGSHNLTYQGDTWYESIFGYQKRTYHKDQAYYGLRIPVSEKENSNGKAYTQHFGHEKKYYNVDDHLFLLDEASCNHGADAVDFFRGVVIVDGKLNLKFLEGLNV